MLRSVSLPGLRTDEPERVQYEWLSTWGLEGATVRDARVAEIRIGEHDGFYVINGRVKATFEHPFLVRRDEEWGFCSAEMLAIGDALITLVEGELDEERIESIERIDSRARTVAILVPGTNTYLADGVWTHNDADLKGSSGPGPGISNSGGSSGLTISESVTGGSSSSSSGSKSSGSSFSSSSSIGFSNTGVSSSVAE